MAFQVATIQSHGPLSIQALFAIIGQLHDVLRDIPLQTQLYPHALSILHFSFQRYHRLILNGTIFHPHARWAHVTRVRR